MVLLVTVAFPLLFSISCIIYKWRKFLHPRVKMPEHFNQQYPYSYFISQNPYPLQEKYDQINGLNEKIAYSETTKEPEDNLCTVEWGMSMVVPEYYNDHFGIVKLGVPYRNI
ncbi:hypothetical protein UPYG_G00026190 [Umbra pygmaea]|uniref:Uncharacterized protein n=1 Tax=Umbra pygmaea TaxID=75934 RepID=A0ABD0Y0H5_UMBPY